MHKTQVECRSHFSGEKSASYEPENAVINFVCVCACACVWINIMHICTTSALTKSVFLCVNILVSNNCSFSVLFVSQLFKAV